MKPHLFLLTFCLSAVCFYSCSKNSEQAPVVLSTEEFIRYNVNGNNYNFTKPVDKLFSANHLNNPQPPPTTLVYGERIPNPSGAATVNILFERTGVTQGSTPILQFFYTQQTNTYYYTSSSPSPVLITITEYGNVGEYIAGNFSGLFFGANNYQFNITCSFRVKRVI